MTRVCRNVQRTLAEHGPAALQHDEAAQRHLEECDDCFAVLESLSALDAAFEAMPPLDAPDELIQRLLASDELSSPSPAPRVARPSWGEALASGVRQLFATHRMRLQASLAMVLLGVIGLSFFLQFLRRQQGDPMMVEGADLGRYAGQEYVAARVVPSEESGERSKNEQLRALGLVGEASELKKLEEERARRIDVITKSGTRELQGSLPAAQQVPPARRKAKKSIPIPDPVVEPEPLRLDEDADMMWIEPEVQPLDPVAPGARQRDTAVLDAKDDELPFWVGTEADPTLRRDKAGGGQASFRGGSPRVEPADSNPLDEDAQERQRVRDRLRDRLRYQPRLQEENEEAAAELYYDYGEDAAGDAGVLAAGLDERQLAQHFLAQRDAVEGLSFQPTGGYWSNTYVPGDPALRYLQARLADRDRSALEAFAQSPLHLHDAARQTTQPFDPPTDAAMAVYLHADRSGLAGESRMLVQVGLVATERYGGRRPAMNVGVVLDLTAEVTPATAASLRALVAAFGEARDVGDRFRLIAAGRDGGEVLGPQDFKHGPLTVAMRNLFPTDGTAVEGAVLGLIEAVKTAIEAVAGGDDPTAPLGSSAVVVVTPRPLGSDAAALAELAHASAVAGVPVSAVGVGGGVELAELERLALAGQGSRRLLRQPAEAGALVERELSAVGRVVARAVRLRIGLAPGVRLIEVIGARRYGEADADKVRRSERSIDLRVARNLGIEADRGDDEPGIQIVIPTFYAGDRHAVLLDVVAPGPGPVADVTVKFKDLVHLGNGVVRASLDLPRGKGNANSVRGPLERNVLKNLLANRLRGVLESAGHSVASGDRQAAARQLDEHRRLLAGLGLELPGFDQDRDLVRDVAMLDEYVGLLGTEVAESPEERIHLAESLRYAGRLKVLPAPVMGSLR